MQINRPNQQRVPRAGTSPPGPSPRPQNNHSTQTPPTPLHYNHPRKSKKVLLIAVLLLLAFAAIFALWRQLSSQVMTNRYQAVFLNNGQVYFGKLHDYYGSRPYMTEVYYFQSNGQSGVTAAQQSGGSQLLVKLGQEIHAPENKLILNKDSIVFVENLTDNGKVTEAIKKDAHGSAATTESTGGITR